MATRYQDGTWDKSIAFRVSDPTPGREGFMRIVCGLCVSSNESSDSRSIGGGAICEQCDLPVGRDESHEASKRFATTPQAGQGGEPTTREDWRHNEQGEAK